MTWSARSAPPAAGAERRSRLRQYQAQLLERVQQASAAAPPQGRELGLLLGQRRCLLDLTQISEIAPLPAVTAVPLTQHWYLGLANVRGNLHGVIDLARYLGEPPAAAGGAARLVTFNPALGFNCALLVGGVLGLRRLDALEAAPAEPDAPGWCAQQFREADGAGWTRVDLAQLVREPRFLQVGRLL